MKKMQVIDIVKGIGLIVLIWIVHVVVAFVIFNRETSVSLIIPAWLVADATLYIILLRAGFINRWVNIFAVLFIVVLAIFYLIPISQTFSQEALELNTRISAQHDDKYQYAKELFFEMEGKWSSPVRQYLLEPHKVFFIKSGRYLWNVEEGKYVDSNTQASLYRNLLIQSGRFSDDEVVVEQHWCTNSPHGVVAIQKDDEILYADLWAVDNFEGYKFGQYTASPCDVLTGKAFE